MLNQIVLVGRLVKTPEVTEYETGGKLSRVTLAVPRSYKNVNGEYETDFFECTLWQGIAENAASYCKKGDLIGIKGRLQSSNYEKDGIRKYVTNIIAEKLTFLSSNKNNEEKAHGSEEE